MKNNLKQTRVCVVGLGYIGLPTAALIANSGYKVCGVDIDKNAVETINKGEIHIVEPGLKKFVKSAVQASALSAFEEPQESDIYIICVPTPFYPDNEIPSVSQFSTTSAFTIFASSNIKKVPFGVPATNLQTL